MNYRLIKINELCQILGKTRQTIWRMERRGDLPKRVYLSDRVSGFRSDELDELIKSSQGPIRSN